MNNLPADVMYTMGVRLVLAVDVGSADEVNLTNYGDYLNGFWVLWRRWWPWAEPIRVLDMQEIQVRYAFVQLREPLAGPSCVRVVCASAGASEKGVLLSVYSPSDRRVQDARLWQVRSYSRACSPNSAPSTNAPCSK